MTGRVEKVCRVATRSCQPRWRAIASRGLAACAAAGIATLMHAPPAHAQGQFIPCAALNLPLVQIPEIVAQNGKLRQTILLTDVTQRSNLTPSPTNTNNCVAQYVRNFVGLTTTPARYPGVPPRSGYAPPTAPNEFYADPVPGPTLRARVGDLIELTFLNQVDPSHYGDTIDKGDSIGACDESTSGRTSPGAKGYPEKAHETYPDCFHGSSSANIHFHGTHTNPTSTGDNVFINLAPSPRAPDTRQQSVTTKTASDWLDSFFTECEHHLAHDVLSEWPHVWNDLPQTYRQDQTTMLQAYDANRPDPQKVWPVDQTQIAEGLWPQYYIGAYPYCFRLPDYTAGGWPPPAPPREGIRPGRVLQMGQSPGTHWYHAHKHGSTTINVLNGMTGAFIIEGDYDDELNRFYGTIGAPPAVPWTRAQPVLVINELGVSPPLLGGGNPGLPFSVNGRIQPVLTMRPGEAQMWRIVNTSSRSFANILGPPPEFQWRQLAQDGIQFSQANYDKSRTATSFMLAPGNRVDLLVQAPATAGLTPVMVQQTVSRLGLTPTSPSPVTLMSVQVTGDPPANKRQTEFITRAPTPPAFLADITDGEIKGTRNITFNSKPSLSAMQHTVDGKQFDGSTGEVVLLNRAEEWTVMNTTVLDSNLGPNTAVDHPFHIHINPFQVVEVFDPNEPLINATTGEAILDPESGVPQRDSQSRRALTDSAGKPVMDAKTLKPYSKYVFDPAAKKRDDQCVIDPHAKPSRWTPCESSAGSQPALIWWDTFPTPMGKVATDAKGQPVKDANGLPIVIPGYFKMRSRFVDYPGLYVLHCHILAHEDRGMMTVVDLRPLNPPVQHH